MDKRRFALVRGPVDPHCVEGFARAGDGGIARFVGVVRDRAGDGRAVVGLSYEAFEPMALREFEVIAQEACDRYGDAIVSIAHAIGDLDAGQIAVAVEAAAPHRAEAFEACRYAIEQLKRRAPIWKRERYAGGESAWTPNRE